MLAHGHGASVSLEREWERERGWVGERGERGERQDGVVLSLSLSLGVGVQFNLLRLCLFVLCPLSVQVPVCVWVSGCLGVWVSGCLGV